MSVERGQLRRLVYVNREELSQLASSLGVALPWKLDKISALGVSLSLKEKENLLRTTEKIVENLREQGRLQEARPHDMDSMTDPKFVYETMKVRKVVFSGDSLMRTPLKALVVWVSDPLVEPSDEAWKFFGTFTYLTEVWLDSGEFHTVWSGCSALAAIVRATRGEEKLVYPLPGPELLGRQSGGRHPLERLQELGGVVSPGERVISALYRMRYMTNEQVWAPDGSKEVRVNDLLGYPYVITDAVG